MPRARGRHKQTERTLRLLGLLRDRPSGVRLQELKTALRIGSHAQLMRDLRALDAGGQRVKFFAEEDPPFYRRARLGEQEVSKATSTRRERYTLLAVQAMLGALVGTPFEEDGASVFDKVTDRLSAEEKRDLVRLAQRITYIPHGGTKVYAEKADILDAFQTGVMQRRLVTASRGDSDAVTWAPLGLALYRHGVYVVAAQFKEGDAKALGRPRVYALERFDTADVVRGSHFEAPADFDVRRYFDGSFGLVTGGTAKRVVLHFDRVVARSVSGRRMHESQIVTPLPDGRGVRMELVVTNLLELASWVLGWGPRVEVIEPERLRKQIAKDHARAARKYGALSTQTIPSPNS